MKRFIRDAIAYGAVSLVALSVDFLLLYALVRLSSVGYIGASAISFMAGATVAYALSIRIVFTEHRLDSRREEFLGFVAIGVIGLGINTVVISVGVRHLGLNYLFAKCMATGCTFTFNFLTRRQLLFRRRRQRNLVSSDAIH